MSRLEPGFAVPLSPDNPHEAGSHDWAIHEVVWLRAELIAERKISSVVTIGQRQVMGRKYGIGQRPEVPGSQTIDQFNGRRRL